MRKPLMLLIMLAMIIAFASTAMAGGVNLKLASFMAPNHVQHKEVIEPWAKEIAKASGVDFKVTIFAAGALGKPPEHYDMAAKGIADLSFPILAYSPGRFRLSSVFELPFMFTTAQETSAALWKVYEKYLKDEFKDVKVLWLFQHGPAHIFTTKKQIETLGDMQGLKMRCTNPFANGALKVVGAVPVFMPVPEVYPALERGVIDGTTISYEGLVAFKQEDVTKYACEVTLYSLNMAIVMNKKKFDALPEAVKKAIEANSGLVMSQKAGKAFDLAETKAKAIAVKKGMKANTLPMEELVMWKTESQAVWEEWAQDMEAKGLPGKAVLTEAMSLLGHRKAK
jgi:TRAP-type C4-dicarboxylate transport system substrate-binding protein